MVQQGSPFSHPSPPRSPTGHYPLLFLPGKRHNMGMCCSSPSLFQDGFRYCRTLRKGHWSQQLCCWQDLANGNTTSGHWRGLFRIDSQEKNGLNHLRFGGTVYSRIKRRQQVVSQYCQDLLQHQDYTTEHYSRQPAHPFAVLDLPVPSCA